MLFFHNFRFLFNFSNFVTMDQIIHKYSIGDTESVVWYTNHISIEVQYGVSNTIHIPFELKEYMNVVASLCKFIFDNECNGLYEEHTQISSNKSLLLATYGNNDFITFTTITYKKNAPSKSRSLFLPYASARKISRALFFNDLIDSAIKSEEAVKNPNEETLQVKALIDCESQTGGEKKNCKKVANF